MSGEIFAIVASTVAITIATTLFVQYLFKKKTDRPVDAPAPTSESEAPSQTFTLGDSKEQVLSVLGVPRNVIGSTWFYNEGLVDFSFGVVRRVQAYHSEELLKFRIDPSKL
jgi:hypothetical protein